MPRITANPTKDEGKITAQIDMYISTFYTTEEPKQMEALDCLSNLLALKRFRTAQSGDRMRCRCPLSPG